MTLTDPQYKTLLDSQAVLRLLADKDDRLADYALTAAAEITMLINQAERIDYPTPEDAEMPF